MERSIAVVLRRLGDLEQSSKSNRKKSSKSDKEKGTATAAVLRTGHLP